MQDEIFQSLCQLIANDVEMINTTSHSISVIDVYTAFAFLGSENKYTRPIVDSSNDFEIISGRHPVVLQSVGDNFIPNDCALPNDDNIWLITGPNMSGKSTFLRQNALNSLNGSDRLLCSCRVCSYRSGR